MVYLLLQWLPAPHVLLQRLQLVQLVHLLLPTAHPMTLQLVMTLWVVCNALLQYTYSITRQRLAIAFDKKNDTIHDLYLCILLAFLALS